MRGGGRSDDCGKNKGNGNRGSFDCVTRKVRELLRSGMTGVGLEGRVGDCRISWKPMSQRRDMGRSDQGSGGVSRLSYEMDFLGLWTRRSGVAGLPFASGSLGTRILVGSSVRVLRLIWWMTLSPEVPM